MSDLSDAADEQCVLCPFPACRKGDLCKGQRLTTMPIKQMPLEEIIRQEKAALLKWLLGHQETQGSRGNPHFVVPASVIKAELKELEG